MTAFTSAPAFQPEFASPKMAGRTICQSYAFWPDFIPNAPLSLAMHKRLAEARGYIGTRSANIWDQQIDLMKFLGARHLSRADCEYGSVAIPNGHYVAAIISNVKPDGQTHDGRAPLGHCLRLDAPRTAWLCIERGTVHPQRGQDGTYVRTEMRLWSHSAAYAAKPTDRDAAGALMTNLGAANRDWRRISEETCAKPGLLTLQGYAHLGGPEYFAVPFGGLTLTKDEQALCYATRAELEARKADIRARPTNLTRPYF